MGGAVARIMPSFDRSDVLPGSLQGRRWRSAVSAVCGAGAFELRRRCHVTEAGSTARDM